jgi:hypothetical protein
MQVKRRRVAIAALVLVLTAGAYGFGDVISGTISNWPESGPTMSIGDGNNHVTLWWSINTFDRGWFYGSGFTGDSDVAFVPSITDVTQISDASIYTYTAGSVGPASDADVDPDGVGDFLIWRNINSGYYGVLRVDDIHDVDLNQPYGELDGTWWFQTDGTGNFVPEPGTLVLLAAGLMLARRRR